MKEIEIYDILTLEDDKEYTVIKKIEENNKTYYLIAPIDESETPNLEEIKIMEEVKENSKIYLDEIEDEKILEKISRQFLSSLKEEFE